MSEWQIEASEHIMRSPWLNLRADRCRLPDGRAIAPVYVIESADFVHAVAVTDDRQLVLSRQYRHAIRRVTLELPGGLMDAADRSPLLAAQRELREETGYAGGAWQLLTRFAPNAARFANTCHVYLALGVQRIGAPRLDDTEHVATVCMPLDEVLAAIDAGAFEQAQEVGALLLALRRLGRSEVQVE